MSSHEGDDPPDDEDGVRPAPPRLTVTRETSAGPVRVHVWPAAEDAARRPVLVCLHGWTDSGLGFGPLAAALGRRWTVVAPDSPGHGGTPWPAAPRFCVPDHVATALTAVDQLPEVAGRRADVVVLGHSMGALTASRVAAARPGVVRHLVLEDPARAALRRVRSAAAMRAHVSGLRALDDAGLIAAARGFYPEWPHDELEAWAAGKRAVSLESLSVPVAWGEPLGALLADVPVPVTLVRGTLERGGIVSALAARRCAAACRAGCEVVGLDVGHHPRRSARGPFIAVLASVLGRYER